VVSCHTPLLAETDGMLRGSHFSLMRPGAVFLNTARGGVVNEPELIEVLRRRPDVFAVLDVTDPEPPVKGSPLLSLPNVVVTPHIAGSLGAECRRMARMMIAETERYRRGEPLQGEVFPAQLPILA
jgi:phosphoglycerate dehydrogenase-like enzyme